MSTDTRAAQALLDGGDVIDGDDPSQPAAALVRATTDGATERRLVGCRVVKCRHDLDIDAVREREGEVTGAEGGVDTSVDERGAQL
jgi:hypothetical protein